MALTAAPTVGGLAGTASARAAQETAAQVAGLKAQQQAALDQAAHRAAQQGQLATAAGTFLEGLDLGGKTASDYANAAAAQTAAASGFQGGLQQTVSDAAAQVQANLAAGGSPQTAYNPGQAAGNALYGLGGYLPSAQLGILGPSQAASMRTFAPMVLGYGQQLAAAALGTGQQAAAAFGPEISAALARQPALAASYLDALQERARQAAQDRADNAYRAATLRQNANQFAASQRAHAIDRAAELRAGNKPTYGGNYQDGIYKIDQRTGKFSWVTKPQPAPVTAASLGIHYGRDGEITQLLPNGKIAVLRAATPSAATQHTKIVSDSSGQWLIDSATGKTIAKVGGPASSYTPRPSATPSYQSVTLPNGKEVVFNPKTGGYMDPLTGKPVTVKEFTRPKPSKPPKPVKPYSISQGVLTRAEEMAQTAFRGGTALTLGGTSATIGGGQQKPYQQAYQSLFKFLTSFDVPPAVAVSKARQLLLNAGYYPPTGGGAAEGYGAD